MMGSCPVCKEIFDADGFYEHENETDGVPLYYCGCSAVFDSNYQIVSANMGGLTQDNANGYIRGSRLKSNRKPPLVIMRRLKEILQ